MNSAEGRGALGRRQDRPASWLIAVPTRTHHPGTDHVLAVWRPGALHHSRPIVVGAIILRALPITLTIRACTVAFRQPVAIGLEASPERLKRSATRRIDMALSARQASPLRIGRQRPRQLRPGADHHDSHHCRERCRTARNVKLAELKVLITSEFGIGFSRALSRRFLI